jgi:Raf kinase inhibitor-like YbhB/YbcL family protein
MHRSVRIMCARRTVVALAVALLSAQRLAAADPAVTGPSAVRSVEDALALHSTDFAPGGVIAPACVYNQFGCHGGNGSPGLSWNHPPVGARSFAVLLFDPDAPGGWWHWAVFDIPAGVSSLRSGAGDPVKHLLPAGAVQVRNDFGYVGYGGPCPPPGQTHHYRLMLYALRVAKLGLDAGASAAQVAARVQANSLARAEIVARYGR